MKYKKQKKLSIKLFSSLIYFIMGDSNVAAKQEVEQEAESTTKISLADLKESKPAPNISIKAIEESGEKEEDTEKIEPEKNETNAQKPSGPAKIETVFEKLDMSSDKSDSTTDSTLVEGEKNKQKSEIPDSNLDAKDISPSVKQDKFASDIFSLKEVDANKSKTANTIWSISGAPSGRINRKKDLTSNVFPVGCMGCKEEPPSDRMSPRRFMDAKEAAMDCVGHIDSTPRKRPGSSKPRNPLTGAGIDQEAMKFNNRKKGNL